MSALVCSPPDDCSCTLVRGELLPDAAAASVRMAPQLSDLACAAGAVLRAYLGQRVDATAAALRWDALYTQHGDTARANDAIVTELACVHPHRHWLRLALADTACALGRREQPIGR